MSNETQEPWNCGGLDYCPECGATGDYDELKQQRDELAEAIDAIASATVSSALDDGGLCEEAVAEIQGICRKVKGGLDSKSVSKGELAKSIADLIFDLDAIGFGQTENEVNGGDAVDCINQHIEHLRSLVTGGGAA